MKKQNDYTELLEFATTDRQKEILQTLIDTNTVKDAVAKLGLNSERSVYEMLQKLRYNVTKKGKGDHFISETNIPEGLFVKSTSTLYKTEDKLQWVKTDTELQNKLEAFSEAIVSIVENIKPIAEIKFNNNVIDHAMTIYTIGDAHIGMRAWDRETGVNHDLEIGEKQLLTATAILIEQSLPTEECLIVEVGDFFHSDNMDNKTAKSGNSLDVDGRYAKVLEVGLNIVSKLIEMALAKHKIVRWRSAIGNHNEHSAIMLTLFIKAYFRNNLRVIIEDSPNMFFYYRFGKNLIGVTHGHTVKMQDLGSIMSVDAKEMWGETEYKYWYTGHIHHDKKIEYRNCIVESFRTLAPKDAWHNASGYRSGNDMKAITIHKDYGEISRNTVGINLVIAYLGEKK